MRYEGSIYRPPSEAYSYILQATIGCSWNKCTYCAMYREKEYRERPLPEILDDIRLAQTMLGEDVQKVFVADGDALGMPMALWIPILEALRSAFPKLRRVSCYATAPNVLEKGPLELRTLKEHGLELLYLGPESGDDLVMKRIAKGSNFEEHVRAADLARDAGMKQSAIFLLGAGGTERSLEHAEASGRLATAMDPEYLAALTLTVIEGTPLGKLAGDGRFTLPEPLALLRELHSFIEHCDATSAAFSTSHASNYLTVKGRLSRDKQLLLSRIDEALRGERGLRPEWQRGL